MWHELHVLTGREPLPAVNSVGVGSPLLSAAVCALAVQISAWLGLLWSGWSSAFACLYGKLAPWQQSSNQPGKSNKQTSY